MHIQAVAIQRFETLLFEQSKGQPVGKKHSLQSDTSHVIDKIRHNHPVNASFAKVFAKLLSSVLYARRLRECRAREERRETKQQDNNTRGVTT